MAAKPAGSTITGITDSSDGPQTIGGSTFCAFDVVTTYSGKAQHGDSLSWYLTDTGSTTNTDDETTSLGRSPRRATCHASRRCSRPQSCRRAGLGLAGLRDLAGSAGAVGAGPATTVLLVTG